MSREAEGSVCWSNSQSSSTSTTIDSGRVPLNALKHGLRSGQVLLPGDDAAAFGRLRHELFDLYRPRTVEEARCVETIAASHWRIARSRLVKSAFDRHLGAVLSGHPDATGYVCEPDPHRLFHRSMDCVLEEGRLDRLMARAEKKLALLQKQRALNFTAADGLLHDVPALLAAGEPPAETGAPPAVPEAQAAARATAPKDRRNGKIRKRNPTSPVPPVPEHWNIRKPAAAVPTGQLAARDIRPPMS